MTEKLQKEERKTKSLRREEAAKAKAKKHFPGNANLGQKMISDWLPNGLIDGHTYIAYFRYLMYYFWRVLNFDYFYMLPPIHGT